MASRDARRRCRIAHTCRSRQVMDGRAADLVTAIESPGGDERLLFARHVVERHGIAVGPRPREATRRYLLELALARASRRTSDTRAACAAAPTADAAQRRAAHATLYRDRGLSSDTSLRVDFALEQALAAVRDRGELAGRSCRARRCCRARARLRRQGAGIRFLSRADDSAVRARRFASPLGIAERPAVTALDISPRVIAHLREARQRASRRETYR